MIVVSETKLFIMAIFTAIGVITTLVIMLVYLYYVATKMRKSCYQCGDDIDKTRRVGDKYYCDYCINVGHAKFNEEWKQHGGDL